MVGDRVTVSIKTRQGEDVTRVLEFAPERLLKRQELEPLDLPAWTNTVKWADALARSKLVRQGAEIARSTEAIRKAGILPARPELLLGRRRMRVSDTIEGAATADRLLASDVALAKALELDEIITNVGPDPASQLRALKLGFRPAEDDWAMFAAKVEQFSAAAAADASLAELRKLIFEAAVLDPEGWKAWRRIILDLLAEDPELLRGFRWQAVYDLREAA